MRASPCLAAALLPLVCAVAPAQEADPFVGHFVDAASGQSELLLVPRREGPELEGVLVEGEAAGGGTFELRGARDGDVLRGRCSVDGGGDGGEFVVREVAEGLVVAIGRGGSEVRFERVPGSPRDAAELRGVLDKLLPRVSDEEAALRALKALCAAQAEFLSSDDDGDGARDFGTLAELGAAGRIDAALARGERQGYRFAVRTAGEGEGARWLASAVPLSAGGGRCFVVSMDGAIWVTKGAVELPGSCDVPPGATRLGARAPQDGPDLSHVRPGQRYRYVLTNPGAPEMQMVFRVVSIEGTTVKYEISTLMDMGQGLQPVGEPTPQEWRYEQFVAQLQARDDAKVEVRRERLTVSGVTFDCMVTTTGAHVAWVPATGDVPTFPGIVKVTSEGKVTMELVAVQQP